MGTAGFWLTQASYTHWSPVGTSVYNRRFWLKQSFHNQWFLVIKAFYSQWFLVETDVL